jgi:CheY-like chemotaxis protein
MIVTKGMLPGLPALIHNGYLDGFFPYPGSNTEGWQGLPARNNDNRNLSGPFDVISESVNNWKDKIILIAEDEDANFLYLKAALAKTRATVLRAKNGREAIDLIRNHPEIDLVLMDIKMPVMNGIDATKLIRSFNGSLVVIAQTAYAEERDRKVYIDAGCNDLLTKPYTQSRLLKTISKYL